ncbi:hypothetical protein [Botrimarina hoheduenensis]|uniref:Uncharacterized protein n=1 Tax=Botrimarina hoheduenensis TaxID=2528000 RepID=A0A5C5W711_9BACT|nr:hypothetical protein [Botrimarina hoheduenensis]TWT46648.1 hypothetical protein Pla111_17490 [Botrimarina hoheduenensis]
MLSIRRGLFTSWQLGSLSLMSLLLLLAPGCDRGSGSAVAPPPPAEPTAEDRYANFLESLKRWVESDDIRSAVALTDLEVDPGTPVTSWRSSVEHRLIKPKNPGDEYRAEVAIRTKSSVTMVIPPSEEVESDPDQRNAERDNAENELALDLPKELRALQQRPSASDLDRLRSSPIVEREKERVSRYELAYRDNRWVLITELDPDSQPFNAGAIEYALNQQ